eukprot:TRINITY_DN1690_c0_g1_i1.p1 TRINITY_DN1690_c0_g1~~TRINITY_DN1690_c0_g1_i1.p1  ORF type:complete len:232 (+),score=36.53 TRINITY_DN1690_c0_g1_i1:513-1208(+)
METLQSLVEWQFEKSSEDGKVVKPLQFALIKASLPEKLETITETMQTYSSSLMQYSSEVVNPDDSDKNWTLQLEELYKQHGRFGLDYIQKEIKQILAMRVLSQLSGSDCSVIIIDEELPGPYLNIQVITVFAGKLKYKVLAEGVEFYETCSLVEALIGFFTLLYSSNKPYSPTGVLLNILIDLFMFERVQTESYTKKTITQYEEIRSIHNQSQAAHLHLPEIFRHPQKRNR